MCNSWRLAFSLRARRRKEMPVEAGPSSSEAEKDVARAGRRRMVVTPALPWLLFPSLLLLALAFLRAYMVVMGLLSGEGFALVFVFVSLALLETTRK